MRAGLRPAPTIVPNLWHNNGVKERTALILSDLHFGDSRCTLHDMETVRGLVQRLQPYTPLHEIVLLGDILDLQLANWAQAVEGTISHKPFRKSVGFRYFINYLLDAAGARTITYVPGNHDYRIYEYHSIEKHLLRPLRNGRKLSGRAGFFRSFSDGFLQGVIDRKDAKLQIVYPHYSMRLNGSTLILTHGHFFDPTQAFNQEIGRVFRGSVDLTREQVSRIRHRYFRRVSLYQNVVCGLSMKKELRDAFSALYQPVSMLKHKLSHRSRKTFLTPAMIRSIRNYVRFCCRAKNVEGIIFGHTHRPGQTTIGDGIPRVVWNCGSFLRESPKSPLGSFITVRSAPKVRIEDAVQVHLL